MEDYRLGRLAARVTSGFGWLLCGLALILLFWAGFTGATVTAASGFSLSFWSLINIPLMLASGGLFAWRWACRSFWRVRWRAPSWTLPTAPAPC